MDLTRPVALALLGLIPLLYWLAIPPRPRRSASTAHLPLWEVALQRLRRQPERFRHLRFWLLVLALSSVGFAAAGPVLRGRAGADVVAIVLDNSPSMAALEADGSTAFDRARDGLRRVVPILPPGLRFRLGFAGPDGSPTVVRGTSDDVLAAVEGLEVVAAAGFSVRDVAAAFANGPDSTALWTWTDARGDGDVAPTSGALELVGAATLPNAAWLRVEVEDAWPLPEIVFRGEIAWSGGAVRPDVTIVGDALEVESVEVDGDAEDGTARIAIRALRRAGGEAVLGLVRSEDGGPWSDAQPTDDRVSVRVAPPGASRIGLMARRDAAPGRWIERAGGVLAELAGGQVVEVEPGDQVDLLLVEGGALAGPVPRSCTFGTAFGASTSSEIGAATPVVDDWNRRHPLTAGLDLSELVIRQRELAPLPSGTVLISSDAGPLAVARDGPGGRSLHLAFRLGESNLPYLAALPQLLRRALTWTAAVETRAVEVFRGDAAEARLIRAGGAGNRDLPVLATPDRSLVGVLLLMALGFLAARTLLR
ncbi:MAG: BatA domain-containing protein [Planctomycetota bacterium]|nr:BatA domain-containing protein [Planctomycetota bacterium]